MYTNIQKYGGNFKDVLDNEFAQSEGVTIASGYISLDILKTFETSFVRIAKNGGTSRLLIGMAFYEGLSQKKT